jgi:hypothetical protein
LEVQFLSPAPQIPLTIQPLLGLQNRRSPLSMVTGQALGQFQNDWVEFQGDIWIENHPPVAIAWFSGSKT